MLFCCPCDNTIIVHVIGLFVQLIVSPPDQAPDFYDIVKAQIFMCE